MNKLSCILAISIGLLWLINVVLCATLKNKEEIMALSRDGMYREDPDELLYGFFPAWAVVMFLIAVACVVIGILGLFGYITGICRNPHGPYQLNTYAE